MCNFSVGYNIIDNCSLIDIRKYLMKKHGMKLCFDILNMFIGL